MMASNGGGVGSPHDPGTHEMKGRDCPSLRTHILVSKEFLSRCFLLAGVRF
jgi:hypothetical protein